jgi:hypothetical protein
MNRPEGAEHSSDPTFQVYGKLADVVDHATGEWVIDRGAQLEGG